MTSHSKRRERVYTSVTIRDEGGGGGLSVVTSCRTLCDYKMAVELIRPIDCRPIMYTYQLPLALIIIIITLPVCREGGSLACDVILEGGF